MHSDDPEMHSSEPNSQDDMDADAGRGRTTVSTMPTFKFMPQPRNNIHNTSSHLFARSQQKQIRPPPVPFSLNSSSFRPSTIAPRYPTDSAYEDAKPSRPFASETKPSPAHVLLTEEYFDHRSSPASYALPPTPISEQRPRSRSGSVLQDIQPGSREPEDVDITQIMSRKMKEADMAKQQLANERLSVARLTSEQKLLRKENNEVQDRLSRSEIALSSHQSDLRASSEELRLSRARVAELERQLTTKDQELAEVQTSNLNMKAEASQAHTRLTEERDDLMLKIRSKADEMEAMRKKLSTLAEERADKIKRAAMNGLEDLRKRYDELHGAYTHLKTVQDTMRKDVRSCKDDIHSTRQGAEQALESVRPILDHTGHYWVKGADTRGILEELQADRENGRVVNDMLRAKLEIQGAELATALSKIVELEGRDSIRETSRMREVSAVKEMGSRMQCVAEKLVKKEDSENNLLYENATLQQRIQDINQQCQSLKNRMAQSQTNLQDAEEQKRAVISEQDILQVQLKDKKEECHRHESRLATLQEENGRLNEAVGSWKKQAHMQIEEIKRMTALIESLKRNTEISSDEARKATMALSALQDRFESQALTLTLTKESCGDAQERLLSAEKTFAEERAAFRKEQAMLEADVKILRESSASTVEVLKEQLENNRTSSSEKLALQRASRAEQQVAEFSNVIIDLRTLLTNQTTQMDFIQADLAHTKASIQEDIGKETSELVTKIDSMTVEMTSLRNKNTGLQEDVREARTALDGLQGERSQEKAELARLRDIDSRMRIENDSLTSNQNTLIERYKAGSLSDVEKQLVSNVMASSLDHHERELVQKQNELRRRDNMIETLQAKVKNLEATLSQRLSDNARDLEEYRARQELLEIVPNGGTSKSDPLKSEPHPLKVDSVGEMNIAGSRTFAELSKSDDMEEDIEDDKPLSRTSMMRKRPAHDRPVSPSMTKEEDRARPARRAKINAQKKIDILPEQLQDIKPVAPKTKSRKRH